MNYALAILKRGNEGIFNHEAQDSGIVCYYPVQTRVVKPRNKRKPVISKTPLFPGYAFIGMFSSFHLSSGLTGFKRFFSVDDEIIPILPKEIDRLKAREEKGEFNFSPIAYNYHVGELVKILHGALQGYTGKIAVILKGRHVIEIGSHRITVDVDDVGPVIQSRQ